jgi:nitrogen fixation protein FixH
MPWPCHGFTIERNTGVDPHGAIDTRHDHDKERTMAFPTAVNDQITDAVTQSNVKVIGEAPAFAMGALYQSLAHSTGILFENAVAAQQQQNTLAQAATTQGIMQIYSLDTTAAAGATDKVAQTGVADNLSSLLTVLNAFKSPLAAAQADTVQVEPAEGDAAVTAAESSPKDGYDGIAGAVKDAVRFANDTVLGNADAFNAALRQCTDSVVHAIERIQHAQEDALRRMLLDAAMAATLKAMLQAPQRAKEYEEVLQAIKRLG